LQPSPVRILIVDDFGPWRHFVSSRLLKKPEWQVAGEASDGFEAVQKAVELKPDLILLDIGLPTLNGIEAAQQIRELVPESEIIFLSQESSADVVQAALNLGASGYVVKASAGSQLLPAVETVISGKKFVSNTQADYKAHAAPE
jgi:DNA-binding NarL/FixJ family response regulator